MARAKLVLAIEQVWAALWPSATALIAFAAASLFGLWSIAPASLHAVVLSATVLFAAGAASLRLRRVSWPDETSAMKRVEGDSALSERALRGLRDRPISISEETAPLWRAHLNRLRALAARARVNAPKSDLPHRDRYALRLGAFAALIAGILVAGSEAPKRLMDSLYPDFTRSSAGAIQIEAWLTPPAYTNEAPIFLERANAPSRANDLRAPEGSKLSLRIAGLPNTPRIRFDSEAGRETLESEETGMRQWSAETQLSVSGSLVLRAGRERRSWAIQIEDDADPEIRFLDDPVASDNGSLTLRFETSDDFGVANVKLIIALAGDQERHPDALAIEATALETPDERGLTGANRLGEQEVTTDLADHPWAGLEVDVQLEAADNAGQSARTALHRIKLPKRDFFYPLAKSVLEERQNLAIAPSAWPRVARTFSTLTTAPELFFQEPGEYLLLRSAFWSVFNSQGENLDPIVDSLWDLALRLEDGDLAHARRMLEAAIEALMAGLERGASPEEIAALSDDVRTAMNRYVQALAAEARARGEFAESMPENMGVDDLQDMLSAIEELSSTGSNDAAREMLGQLEALLENMRVALSSGGGEGETGDANEEALNEALSDLGDLIGDQRALMDETFDREQDRNTRSDMELEGEQNALLEALQDLMEQFGQQGQNGGDEALGRAQDAMERASDALRGNDLSSALRNQSSSVNELRRSAQALAESLAEQAAGEEGSEGAAVDPAGRPVGARDTDGDSVSVPDQLARQRARDLLEELRRRASEANRPTEELEYLERLLKRF